MSKGKQYPLVSAYLPGCEPTFVLLNGAFDSKFNAETGIWTVKSYLRRRWVPPFEKFPHTFSHDLSQYEYDFLIGELDKALEAEVFIMSENVDMDAEQLRGLMVELHTQLADEYCVFWPGANLKSHIPDYP